MKGWNAAEKNMIVEQYIALPHGRKKVWLAEHGINYSTFRQWRTAFYYGDLDRDLVPRDTSHMTISDGARMARLEHELATERAARVKESEAHAQQVARLEAMNEALGKAIGLLHEQNAPQEPTPEP